jgi:hypothetical protein
MKLIHSMVAGLMCALTAGAAQANVAYTFDNDMQGFTTVGGGSLSHEVVGGDGYLKATDTDGGTNLFLSVPLGAASVDWSGYLGGRISFDALMLNGIPPSWDDFGIIQFTAVSGEFVWADLAASTEPTSVWKTYSGALDSATFGNQGGATLASVLANLKSVTLSMEAGNGAVEVVGVDNFKVTSPVPEPETWALGVAGLMALALSTRRTRR